jgi:CTP synthase (UTP-ammonia lyase)
MARTSIGVIGDFDPAYTHHRATNLSLGLAAESLGIELTCEWIPTESIASDSDRILKGFDGLWASPGSPYRSIDGALAGIRFARESGKPFVGT